MRSGSPGPTPPTRREPAVEAGGLIAAAVDRARADDLRGAVVLARQALALDPGDPVALFNLGQLAGRARARSASVHWLEQAAWQGPGRAETHAALARTLLAGGNGARALEAARRAVALAPDSAPHWHNLALLLRVADATGDADACLGIALALSPRYEAALRHRSIVRAERGDAAGADRLCRRGAALFPAPDPFRRALAGRAVEAGRHAVAERLLRMAVAIAPADAESWTDLGLVRDERPAPGALAALRRALALDPGNVCSRWNRSVLLLAAGDLDAGYRDYDIRWTRPARTDRAQLFRYPLWGGARLAGRLLLWGEQGLGDEILYAGMVPEAAARAHGVTLECEARLVPLFRRSFPQVTVVPRRDPPATETAASDIRAQTTTLRLPRLFRRRPVDFPGHDGYLTPDPDRVRAWRRALAAGGPGPTVGFVWTGGSARTAATKVPPPACWAPLASVPARFVSLLGGAQEAAALAALPAALAARVAPCPDPDLRDDLESAAALVAALDGVVAIATTTAHLAGALGVPGIVLLPRTPIWVWGRRGARCPWYPSLTLARQAAGGDWSGAMRAAARALGRATAAHGA